MSRGRRLKLGRIEGDDQALPMCFSANVRCPAESFLFYLLGDVNVRRGGGGGAWDEARSMPLVDFCGRCQVVIQPEVIIFPDGTFVRGDLDARDTRFICDAYPRPIEPLLGREEAVILLVLQSDVKCGELGSRRKRPPNRTLQKDEAQAQRA